MPMIPVSVVLGLLALAVALSFVVGIVVILRAYQHGHKLDTSVALDTSETLPYSAKQKFFSRSEQMFYNILNSKLDALQHTVFPKVRLGDFITVENLSDNYGSWAKIRSRHVDFLVWDLKDQKIVLAIELDGNSHHSPKAQKNDAFKNDVFKSINLPLHRVQVGSNFYEEVDRLLGSISFEK